MSSSPIYPDMDKVEAPKVVVNNYTIQHDEPKKQVTNQIPGFPQSVPVVLVKADTESQPSQQHPKPDRKDLDWYASKLKITSYTLIAVGFIALISWIYTGFQARHVSEMIFNGMKGMKAGGKHGKHMEMP